VSLQAVLPVPVSSRPARRRTHYQAAAAASAALFKVAAVPVPPCHSGSERRSELALETRPTRSRSIRAKFSGVLDGDSSIVPGVILRRRQSACSAQIRRVLENFAEVRASELPAARFGRACHWHIGPARIPGTRAPAWPELWFSQRRYPRRVALFNTGTASAQS
jgi:hypothetical protein